MRGTILLTSPLPDLSGDLVISGPGPKALKVARSGASQTPAFRIFTVGPGAVIKICGLTITGGGADYGAGIENAGTLSLVDATISGNSAMGYSGSYGGGIDNSGTLSITTSTISGNSATGVNTTGTAATGDYCFGGGIFNSGTMSASKSTFTGNSSVGSIVSWGGGVDNSGSLAIAGCTFSGNSAIGPNPLGNDVNGGGIASNWELAVTNSTFTGNSAAGPGGIGGAIAERGGGYAPGLITYCTLANNSAAIGGGIAFILGGTPNTPIPPALDSTDSIFQNPQGGNISVVAGEFTSLGHDSFLRRSQRQPPRTDRPCEH